MADLLVVATVTRGNLETPRVPLDINDHVNFRLGRAMKVGEVVWRREAATSPYVHGSIPVHEVKEQVDASIEVHVLAETHEELNTNLATLLEAFTDQYTYELSLTVEGQEYRWRCDRADYQIAFATPTLNALVLPVSLAFTRHPIPAAGVF